MDRTNQARISQVKIEELNFNYEQLCYLKLVIKGYSKKEIKSILNLNTKQLTNLIFFLKLKFKENNIEKIIQEAFHKGIVEMDEFMDPAIESNIIKCVNLFFDCHFDSIFPSFVSRKNLLQFILNFYNSCQNKLDVDKKVIIDKNCESFVKLYYRGFECTEIINKLNLSKSDYLRVKRDLLNALKAQNMFNAIREAFKYNILSKEPYLKMHLTDEINRAVEKMIKIDFVNKKLNAKKALLYSELASFYNTIEAGYLFENYKKRKEMLD